MWITTQTQQPTRAQWRVHWLACVAESNARAALCEAAAHRADSDPTTSEAKRAEHVADWRRMAREARATAAEHRAQAAEYDDACICSPPGRLADAPCPRCTPDLSPTDASGLLAAMNHSVHAEVAP
jgi:hypothetical protein